MIRRTVAVVASGSISLTGCADPSTSNCSGGCAVQWPQYLFAGDKVCGDANGQGVGGKWWATKADGGRAGQ